MPWRDGVLDLLDGESIVTGWLSSQAHRRWLESETDRLLDFARGSYRPAGGFGLLDNEGHIDVEGPLDLLITCRMIHVFSLGHLLGRPGCAPLVDHGLDALANIFADQANGGWVREVIPSSGPTNTEKTAYTHAFVVLAASSATWATRPGAAELLTDALQVVATRFWDEKAGLSRETWDASFSETEPYRGANSNMHSVEAYLAAADATGDRIWLQRALRIAEWLIRDVARDNEWRIVEHFRADGTPDLEYNHDDPIHQYRPYGATIGHAMEWARLLLHLRAELGDDAPAWLLEASRALFATAVREGWAVDGADGFIYTVDWAGRPVVRQRLHWVLAEAIGASSALYQATGESQYADWYVRWWDHAAECFLDRNGGSWWHELDTANRPSSEVWSGKPDVYHALQATLVPRLPLAPTIASALAHDMLA